MAVSICVILAASVYVVADFSQKSKTLFSQTTYDFWWKAEMSIWLGECMSNEYMAAIVYVISSFDQTSEVILEKNILILLLLRIRNLLLYLNSLHHFERKKWYMLSVRFVLITGC